jgi:hypothetical protein
MGIYNICAPRCTAQGHFKGASHSWRRKTTLCELLRQKGLYISVEFTSLSKTRLIVANLNMLCGITLMYYVHYTYKIIIRSGGRPLRQSNDHVWYLQELVPLEVTCKPTVGELEAESGHSMYNNHRRERLLGWNMRSVPVKWAPSLHFHDLKCACRGKIS